MTLDELIWRIIGGLAVITALLFIITNTLLRKKVFDKKHVKTVKGASIKISKDAVGLGKRIFKKSDSKKNQLPSTSVKVNNPTPVFTPNKQPAKQEVVIPLANYECPYELIYTAECEGWQLGDEDENGRSIAFRCVGGYDKSGKLKIWIYSPHYHKDTRKKAKNNHEYDLWERVS